MLPVFNFDILVIDNAPPFDEKAMGVGIGPANITQVTFRNQVTAQDGGRSYDVLFTVIPEQVGVTIHVDHYRIHGNLLTDISGNDTPVIATFSKIVKLCLGAGISQVQGLADMTGNYLVIRVERKEIEVEHFNMVPGLHRYIILPLSGECFYCFTIR